MDVLRTAEESLERATVEKSQAAAGQDTWHDEGFKMGSADEMMWSRRVGDLQKIQFSSFIARLEDQDREVKIGNGVLIRYSDGSEKKMIMEGYLASRWPGRFSVYSPLGQTLLMARVGDRKALKVTGQPDQNIEVMKIVSPARAVEFLDDVEEEEK